jgi:hypothetical protein
MILGLRTVIYHVDDIGRAKQWYAEALGIQPYFDEPYYVGFEKGKQRRRRPSRGLRP